MGGLEDSRSNVTARGVIRKEETNEAHGEKPSWGKFSGRKRVMED